MTVRIDLRSWTSVPRAVDHTLNLPPTDARYGPYVSAGAIRAEIGRTVRFGGRATPRHGHDATYDVFELYRTDGHGHVASAALNDSEAVRADTCLVVRRRPMYSLSPDFKPVVTIAAAPAALK